jgi:hypothetical protein
MKQDHVACKHCPWSLLTLNPKSTHVHLLHGQFTCGWIFILKPIDDRMCHRLVAWVQWLVYPAKETCLHIVCSCQLLFDFVHANCF